MSRLIDGDELMELLTTAIRNMKGMAKFLCAEDDPEIQMEIKAYTDIANGVKDIPTIEPEPQWIPCSERLPEAEFGESKNVIVTCEWRHKEVCGTARWIDKLYFNGGNWCYPTGETYENRVIAWMPLPEPWKGET